MPKRLREAAANTTHVESSLESGRKFDAYIRGWVGETTEPRRVRPSSLPQLLPLPSLLTPDNLPAPAQASEGCSTLLSDPLDTTAVSATATRAAGTPVSMSASGTGVVYDIAMLDHVSPDLSDYERPARLGTTLNHLAAVGLLDRCRRIPARSAKTKELCRVHARELVDTVDQLDFFMGIQAEKGGVIGQDLYASAHTSRAARVAAGCAIEAAKAVVTGVCGNAFALVRPPGHHAGPGNAAGFCLYNNIAVAARAAQEELMAQRGDASPDAGRPRVVILDWDVHHCDGTESIFYDDPSVLVISIHQYGHGCGHVLRKTPSVNALGTTTAPATAPATAMDDIDVEGLAALLLPTPEENTTSASAVEAPPTSGTGESEAMPPPAPATEGRRTRRAVDYNRLAAELHDDGADDIAALFGVDVNAVSSSSNSTSSAEVGPSSSSSDARRGRSHKQIHYAGDTVGLSRDDTPLPLPETEEEPFYPGTGHLSRVGGEAVEAAAGRNINIPWPTHDMGDVEYLQVMQEVVLPAAQEFQPDVVLISAGFDSARGDLLGSMALSPSGFYVMTRLMAARFPKLVVALEGGYNVKNVALGSEAVMRALLESSGQLEDTLPRSRMLWCQTAQLVAQVRAMHAPYWKCFSDSAATQEL